MSETTVPRTATHPKPLRVLIVDDYPAMLAWAARAFRSAGWEVETAADGGEAVARWQQMLDSNQCIDLLLTDADLPVLTGAGLAGTLRHHDPKLAILVVSGHATPDADWTQALLRHSVFLRKPVPASALLAAAHRLTSR